MKSSFPVSEAGDWLQAAAESSPLFPATVLLTSSGSRLQLEAGMVCVS